MNIGLKQKAISGVIWSSIQKFGTMGISFASNIILARLLTPEDYGCVGMLMIFITVANTFIDGGFGSALIQKKNPTQEDYSTIFYWNLILSVFLYIILYFSAPLIAQFYRIPLLTSVLRVQSLVLIINSLSIVQQNRMRKNLNFKKLAIISIISSIISLSITICLAFNSFGIWALVAQQLLLSSFNAILYWGAAHWRPAFIFSKQSFKELLGFGGYVCLANLVNTFCNQVSGLIAGRFCTARLLGMYTQSVKLVDVASMSISSVVDQVAYPILSRFQNDKQKLVDVLRNIIRATCYFSFPVVALMILLAEPIILVLYSEKWIESVPYFQILSIAGLFMSIQNINYYGVAALGKSRQLLYWTFIKRAVGLVILIAGFLIWGFYGLLLGFVISAVSTYSFNAILSSKYTGYTLMNQIKDISPILIITALSGLITFFVNHLLLGLYSLSNKYLNAALQFVLFMILYVIFSAVIYRKIFRTIREFIISTIRRA